MIIKPILVFRSFIRALFRDPLTTKIYFHKLAVRFFPGRVTNDAYFSWLMDNAVDVGDFCRDLDFGLWEKSRKYADQLDERAVDEVAPEVLVSMGGGGASALLFFLGVWLKPKYILETGVSLGYSSAALLASSHERRDESVRLFSSDFPYPGLQASEKNIGLLVPETQRGQWKLEIRGDQLNLPVLLSEMPRVDLAHYDSDKSYKGRDFFFTQIQPKIHENSVIIFDDIHENRHFFDLVKQIESSDFKIFRFKKKFIGMLGVVN